jgi:microcystin-dependent protein
LAYAKRPHSAGLNSFTCCTNDAAEFSHLPRDSNGTYSLPLGTLVSVGDTVLVSQHNPAMGDIGEALTNSLDRTGKGGMLGNLPMGGNRVTNVAPGVDPTDAATVAQLTSGTSTPLGAVIDFWGSTVPEGFLLCAGQEISRSTYAALFAVIGTNAGAGNGTTTFNLPDYRGRIGAGKDDMGGTAASRLTNAASGVSGATLGAAGGSQTVTLTEAQMPAHTHSFSGTTSSSGTHTHTVVASDGTVEPGGGVSGSTPNITTTPTSSSGAHTHTVSGTTGSTGSSSAHANVQPTIVCNKIIRAI